MIIDIETLVKSDIECDICIIGSGAAGLVLGQAFLRGPEQIVILEAGHMRRRVEDDECYTLESTNLRIHDNSRVRAFGGTTTAWTGGWKPLDSADFEKKDWLPLSGWPIKKSDLEVYYEKASALLNAPHLKDYQIVDQEDGDICSTLLRIIPKKSLNFGTFFKQTFESSSSIRIYLGANVTNIVLRGSSVEKVIVKTLGDKIYAVNAKKFIIACGGVENARLLLASNIGNAHGQVGRYYMDHPKGVSGEIILRDKQAIEKYIKQQDVVGTYTRGLQMSPQARQREKVLNSYVQIRRDFSMDNVLVRIMRKIFGFDFTQGRILVRSFMEQEPRVENRVTLSQKLDPLGNPLAQVAWGISSVDMKSVQMFHLMLKKYLEDKHIGLLKSPVMNYVEPKVWPVKTGASHHMGTTRMGVDPKTSVVDANCRVHGVENLFIAGSSVFPTGGHANPTATIVALALRLADHLKLW